MPDESSIKDLALEPLLSLAIEAAQEAGAMLRAEFHRAGGPRGHGYHADIDAEVEYYLQRRLLDGLACGWLGEETGSVVATADTTWVVDPHDGTEAFLQGLRGSSISIALLRLGRPVLGVVYAFGYPNDRGDLIAWAEGCGPLRRNGSVVESDLGRRDLAAGATVALSQAAAKASEANASLVAPARFLALPSIAYRLALAACGEVVAGASLIGIRAWDVAAGHALLTGAGGILLDGAGAPVVYGRGGHADIYGCFGGAPLAVRVLAARDWQTVLRRRRGPDRTGYDRVRVADADRLDRAQGCLLGQVAGDSLGSLVEFQEAPAIARMYPGGLRELADGGCWSTFAGQPTDDSEMALALARSIARERTYVPAAAFQAYKEWRGSKPFDIGGTTSTALGLSFAESGSRTGTSQANGSLMRVSPIGIASAGLPETAAEWAAKDSALTHPHPVCAASCRAFAAAIAVGIASGSREEMIGTALSLAGHGEAADAVRTIIRAARTKRPANYQLQMGWVLIALQNAFFHLAVGSTLEAGVSDTVMQGGDTDTNGAIVGALLGATDGLKGVPAGWTRAVLSCRPLASVGALQPRPPEYWPDDVLDLAEVLLAVAGARS